MKIPSPILGIDTSCDETSVAVLEGGKKILANIISSQIKLHQPHGGVVPELASRSHLETLPHVVDQALTKAGIKLSDLQGIAVTSSPGLIGCLLVGMSYAKSLAYSLKIPLTCVHHLKGHLFSPFLVHDAEPVYPFIGLVVSGGHTALYYVKDFHTIEIIGQTVDDAAGEAYDKVAKLLGMGYPGGPLIDKLAQKGDPHTFSFTRAKVKRGKYFFSFSGLKTAVLMHVKKSAEFAAATLQPAENPWVWNLAASFQNEVAASLIEKTEMALDENPAQALLVSGGVAVNSLLRKRVQELAERRKILTLIPTPLLCTDNGAMIAYVGARQLQEGMIASLDANAFASAMMW